MLNIAVVDDEKIMCDIIYKLLKDFFRENQYKYNICMFNNGADFIKQHSECNFDIIFLDIEMPGESGMEVAKQLRINGDKSLLMFVTNLENYVYESFQVSPFRFIRKDHIDEINEAIKSAVEFCMCDNYLLPLKTTEGFQKYRVADIYAFTSVGHNVYMCLKNDKVRLLSSLSELELQVDSMGFVRTHSSYIVNCKHIYSIESDAVVLDDGNKIPVSRRRLQCVKENFMNYSRG